MSTNGRKEKYKRGGFSAPLCNKGMSMKKLLIGIIALFLVMAAVPALVSLPKIIFSALDVSETDSETNSNKTKQNSASEETKAAEKSESQSKNENQSSESNSKEESEEKFLLLDENGEKTELSGTELLSGCLAAIMPRDYEEQSGYALAAAVYSHLCCAKENRGNDKTLDGADLAKKENGATNYLTKQEAYEKYGADFYSLCEKYAAFGIKTSIKHDNKAIDAQVFKSCGGITENSGELFSKPFPCHQSVSSPWDALGSIKSQKSLSAEDAQKIISKNFDTDSFPDDLNKYIVIKSTAPGGTVTEAEVCGKSVTGIDIMNAFSLKSPCFTVTLNDGKLLFDVTGEGIPIGMSIDGANGMAKQGAKWNEILEHYYVGASLSA